MDITIHRQAADDPASSSGRLGDGRWSIGKPENDR